MGCTQSAPKRLPPSASSSTLSSLNKTASGLDSEDGDAVARVRSESDGVPQQVAPARFQVKISHIKGRGSVFYQHGCEFYVKFSWAGTERATTGYAAAQSSRSGCKWGDSVLEFEYNPAQAAFSDSMSSLQKQVIGNLQSGMYQRKKSPKKKKQLRLTCYCKKAHHVRKDEIWEVGSAAVDLDVVMSGPLHHVFRLVLSNDKRNQPHINEVTRISYNCRITQVAKWGLYVAGIRFVQPIGSKKSDVNKSEDDDGMPAQLDLTRSASVVDTSKLFHVRYRLLGTDREYAPLFESTQMAYAQRDTASSTLVTTWDPKVLMPIESDVEDNFRSLLSSAVGFEVLENKLQANELEPMGPAPSPSATGVDEPGLLLRRRSTNYVDPNEHGHGTGPPLKPRLAAQESIFIEHTLDLLGECWVPVEQIFEAAQQASLKPSEEGLCTCFDGREHPASARFSKTLSKHGRSIGKLEGVICFDRLPGKIQLGHGVLTEEGVSLVSPIIQQGSGKPSLVQRMLRNADAGVATSPAASKLRSAIQRLERSIKARPEQGSLGSRSSSAGGRSMSQNDPHVVNEYLYACRDMLTALRTSEKESMVAFVYGSFSDLLKMQYTMVGLWELLMDWIDAVTFTVRIAFFDVLVAIMMRGEMGEFMMPSLLHAQPAEEKTKGKNSEAAKLALFYRGLCYRTLAWCLQKLSQKGSFAELRTFCAKVVAIMCFRLPKFGATVYLAVLPPDETTIKEWAESDALILQPGSKTRFANPEWTSGWYSLDPKGLMSTQSDFAKAALRSPRMGSNVAGLQAGQKKNSGDKKTAFEPRTPRAVAVGSNDNEGLLNWRPFERSLEDLFDEGTLAAQEEQLPMRSGGASQSSGNGQKQKKEQPVWLRRIQKHGHFFFLFGREWMIYVLNTIGVLATTETENVQDRAFHSGIRWNKIPGFKHILKSFLLEVRRRKIAELPESLRSLAMMLLIDDAVLDPLVTLVVPKTNLFDLEDVTTCVDLISSWITAMHGWPGRFIAAKMFMAKGPLTAKGAETALEETRSLFFSQMTKMRDQTNEKDIELLEDTLVIDGVDDDELEGVDTSTPQPTMAELRASGHLASQIANTPGQIPRLKYGHLDKHYYKPKPYVTAWDFDSVSVYFPHLDVIRRDLKKDAKSATKKNNDRSKCNWFSLIYADEPPLLPGTFDFSTLTILLWMMLHSDHYQVVLKALQFIYNHWDSFPMPYRDKMRAMMLACGDEYSSSQDKHRYNNFVEWGCRSEEEKQIRHDMTGADRHPLFLTLFFHWAEEVRLFFQTLLAFRICRGKRTKYLDCLMAFARIVFVATKDETAELVWGAVAQEKMAPARADQAVKAAPSSPAAAVADAAPAGALDRRKSLSEQREDVFVAKMLFKAFESEGIEKIEQQESREESFFKRGKTKNEEDDSGILVSHTLDDVTQMIETIESTLDDDMPQEAMAESKQERAPNAGSNGKGTSGQSNGSGFPSNGSGFKNQADIEKKIAQLKADLKLLHRPHLPAKFFPYAIPSVLQFRKIWRDSLDLKSPLPILEWNVVVMDRGEMRSVGGLAVFRPPSPQEMRLGNKDEWVEG